MYKLHYYNFLINEHDDDDDERESHVERVLFKEDSDDGIFVTWQRINDEILAALSSVDTTMHVFTSDHKRPVNVSRSVTSVIVIRDLRIGNFRSNRISNRISGYDSNLNLESNRRIVVYSFNVKFLLIAT